MEIPKDTKATIRKAKGTFYEKRTQASAGTVNKFIEEQCVKASLRKTPNLNTRRAYNWERASRQLYRGKPIMWDGRLINPPILKIK